VPRGRRCRTRVIRLDEIA